MSGATAPITLPIKIPGMNDLQKLERKMEQLERDLAKLNKQLPEASNNVRGFSRASAKASQSVGALTTKLAAAAAAAFGFQQSLSAAFDRGNAEKRLKNLTESTAEYEQALRLAKLASNDFGLTQTETTKALGDVLSRLKGVGFGLTEVNDIYRGFNTIAAQSGVAAEDAAGAFLQLSQALGSGKLQGDELRSILERMPQLAQAIAKQMGIAAGEVRQAGADGKITGDVMFAALKKASEGSFDLTEKLTEQQLTMNEVKQRAEELQVELGNAFAPAILSALNKFADIAFIAAKALEKMNKWATENAATIKKVVAVAIEFGKIVGSVLLVVKAFQLLQKAVAAAAAAKAALMSLSGVGIPLVAAAVTAAAGTYLALTKTIDGAKQAVIDLEAESKKELAAIRQKAAANAQFFRKRSKQTKTEIKDTKKLAAAQKEVTKRIKESVAATDAKFKAQTAINDLMFEITQKRLDVEKQLTDNLLEQAQTQLDNAKNAAEREMAARKIYELSIRQAELERASAKAAVVESLRKAQAEMQVLIIKSKQIAVEVELARASGALNKSHLEALKLSQEAVQIAGQHLQLKRLLAVEQLKEIDAIYQGAAAVAQTAYEQNRVFNETQNAAIAASNFANQMERGAQAANSINAVGEIDNTGRRTYTAGESPNALAMQLAQGGYVTGPTSALIGEGGENEYVVPESKMQSSMARYARGMRGSAVTEGGSTEGGGNAIRGTMVSINTGPVMRMNNKDYVTVSDLNNAVSSMASAMSNQQSSRGYGGQARVS